LIRPLLSLSREHTAQCCDALGLTPVDDPSNRSSSQTRSRIRHELIPLLHTFNPRIEEALTRLASSASEDVTLLEQLASKALQPAKSGGEVRIERKRLASLPLSLQRHAVRMAIAQLIGNTRNVSERHIRAVIDASAGPTGAHLDLPRGIQANITRSAVILTTQRSDVPRLPARAASLPVPGITDFGSWRIKTEVLKRKPRRLSSPDGLLAVLDADRCQNLRVRRWRHGDRFQPLGMQQAKKLQDFFVDAHVSREDRAALPLVVAKEGIAWVATQRPAEWAKVTKETTRFLRITARA
jgi:tRNA(Ile)-lysidine synthase